MVVEGVDYSFARPSPAALAAAGKKFAVRYGGMGSSSKHLTASELAGLRSAGLDVVANVEGAAGGFVGESAGRQWAAAGESHFRALGMPADRPIYFSVDWDAGPGSWADIDAALRGAATYIGPGRVGVYGSYAVIAHCRAADTAAWLWQTYAWSSGKQHPAANLYQYRNGVTIGGGDCDLTRALTVDYGQWGYQGDDMPLSIEDVKTLLNTDGVIAAPEGSKNPDGSDNKFWSMASYLKSTYAAAVSARTYASQALAAARDVKPADVDEVQLAALLAPLLNGSSQAEIEAALRNVFRTGTGDAPVADSNG